MADDQDVAISTPTQAAEITAVSTDITADGLALTEPAATVEASPAEQAAVNDSALAEAAVEAEEAPPVPSEN